MTTLTITFAPVRRDETLTLERRGDCLVANGVSHDLSALAEAGEDTPAEGWVLAARRDDDGGLHAVVVLPHGADAPEALRFPAPLSVEADGAVALPGAKPARPRRPRKKKT